MVVKAIPEGFHSVTPYLVVKGASDAIEFYKRAFGAVEDNIAKGINELSSITSC
jgi:uncharacterized glyoxalase superfamily protein PhnB